MPDLLIKVIPTPYQQVLALLRTDALRVVEQAIATAIGFRIIEDFSTACTTFTQADLSVSGLTISEMESLLIAHRDRVIRFGIALLRDQAATDESEEFPEGEEQDPSEPGTSLGYGTGFGITYATYYNFLAHRSPEEFKAYLKNRRIPKHTQLARELQRVFDSVRQAEEAETTTSSPPDSNRADR